jgi:hypothetical protein
MKVNKEYILEESSKHKQPKFITIPKHGLKSADGKSKGVSLRQETFRGKPIEKYYVATHRARSKSYDKVEQIPEKAIKWIESTG